jgi:hypothetical protein
MAAAISIIPLRSSLVSLITRLDDAPSCCNPARRFRIDSSPLPSLYDGDPSLFLPGKEAIRFDRTLQAIHLGSNLHKPNAVPGGRTMSVRSPTAPQAFAAPPCFFSNLCLRRATIEKAGRSVCVGCSTRLRGVEFPLRPPSLQPLYLTGRAAAEALDMD